MNKLVKVRSFSESNGPIVLSNLWDGLTGV
jgi:hypothetical protein